MPTPEKSTATRGKHAHLLQAGSNIAVLDADIVEHFPNSESVNNALRAFLAFGKQFESVVPAARRPVQKSASTRRQTMFDPRKGVTRSRAVAAKV